MGNCIEHKGIVQERDKESLIVKIEQTSACAACHARGMCSSADMAEKLIEIPNAPKQVAVGDTVTIQGDTALGYYAVRLAFIYPFILLFAVLAIAYYTTYNELLAGVLALGVLVPYYFVLYLLRPALKRKLVFTIKV